MLLRFIVDTVKGGRPLALPIAALAKGQERETDLDTIIYRYLSQATQDRSLVL